MHRSLQPVSEEYDHEYIKYVNFSRTVDNPDKIVATVLDSVGLENHFQLGLDEKFLEGYIVARVIALIA
ncbi:hypothetical protein QUF72_17685 [Desulfobacterales bacterium HSG2]|nr:hypothetical protein [Desulfobacterales bacterium HSG2]